MPFEDLKILSVCGAHSGVGKTTLCSILLGSLKGFGAIKFTKTPLYASLTDDLNILKQEDKDTARLLGAGAEKVLWIKSPYHELKGLIEMALKRMSGLKGVVIEGNSAVDFLNPHLIVLIIGSGKEIKPSALKVCGRADIIVAGSGAGDAGTDPALKIPEKARVFRVDLIKKEGELDELIRFVKERLR